MSVSSSSQETSNSRLRKNKNKNKTFSSYLAISVWAHLPMNSEKWHASPITMLLKNGNVQEKAKKNSLYLSIHCKIVRQITGKFDKVSDGTRYRTRYSWCRNSLCPLLKCESRQGNVQIWSVKEGQFNISIYSDGSVMSAAICHCVWIEIRN